MKKTKNEIYIIPPVQLLQPFIFYNCGNDDDGVLYQTVEKRVSQAYPPHSQSFLFSDASIIFDFVALLLFQGG